MGVGIRRFRLGVLESWEVSFWDFCSLEIYETYFYKRLYLASLFSFFQISPRSLLSLFRCALYDAKDARILAARMEYTRGEERLLRD